LTLIGLLFLSPASSNNLQCYAKVKGGTCEFGDVMKGGEWHTATLDKSCAKVNCSRTVINCARLTTLTSSQKITHYLGCGTSLGGAYDSRLDTCDHFKIDGDDEQTLVSKDFKIKEYHDCKCATNLCNGTELTCGVRPYLILLPFFALLLSRMVWQP